MLADQVFQKAQELVRVRAELQYGEELDDDRVLVHICLYPTVLLLVVERFLEGERLLVHGLLLPVERPMVHGRLWEGANMPADQVFPQARELVRVRRKLEDDEVLDDDRVLVHRCLYPTVLLLVVENSLGAERLLVRGLLLLVGRPMVQECQRMSE